MYTNVEYAYSRLVGTIVREADSNRPILINNVYREGGSSTPIQFSGAYLNGNTPLVGVLSDLNLKAFHIGYVNGGSRVDYLSRMPKRRDWRQGARSSNTYSKQGLTISDFRGDYIEKSVLNIYPSYRECLKYDLQAFSKFFAVRYGKELHYKGDGVVGTCSENSITLDKNHKHLKEMLEEILHEEGVSVA